ncbi:MAG: glycosyltransferase family 2 protein [Cyclobacteriaceae bacterium]|nr:glycosyltransferase family 2 protein [Cyclobacteriaceae bacterium]MCH8517677.1 glycosyltransferase family 2 protein [Cyclobacteriaceae bacterium]
MESVHLPTLRQKTAVVILNYNGRHHLEEYLPSVIQHLQEATLIVVDNASTDDSCAWLEKNYPSIKVLFLPENKGYAGGYNEALLSMLGFEYFVLLNSDVRVVDGWMDAPLLKLGSNDKVAATQPKILSDRNLGYFDYAGASGGFIDKYGYPYCRGRIFSTIEKDEGQYDSELEIHWASGACLFIKSNVFKEFGGFDDSFFAHMEEIDLCWRIINEGYSIYCTPKSMVYHLGGGTLSSSSPFKTYLNFRNNHRCLFKNLSENKYNKVYKKRYVLDILAILLYLFQFKFKHAMSIIKAREDIFKDFQPRQMASKINNQVNTSTDILMQYYLKRRKRYSELIL